MQTKNLTSDARQAAHPRLGMGWLALLSLAAVYVVNAKLGQALAIPPGDVTPVWLPSGVILFAVLRWGPGVWPGVFLGAFVGNASADLPTLLSPAFASALAVGVANGAGDCLGALVGAALIQRFGGSRHPFDSARAVLGFAVFGAVLGGLISALFGVTGLAAAGLETWARYPELFATWWTGDGVGILVLTPLLLALARGGDLRLPFLEVGAFLLILVPATVLGLGLLGNTAWPVGLIGLMPLTIWAVFRLDERAVFGAVAFISAAAVLSATQQGAVFGVSQRSTALIELQLFVSILALTTYVLLGVVRERAVVAEQLKRANEHLDAKVQARTAALLDSRGRLRALIDHMEAGVVVHATDTAIRLANTAAGRLLGIDEHDMQRRRADDPAWHFIEPDGRPMDLADYPVNRILSSGESLKTQLLGAIPPEGGRPRWLLVNGSPLRDGAGELIEIIISFLDVTEQKQAEDRLRNAAAVFATIGDGVLIADARVRITDVNPAFLRISGFRRDELIGHTPRILRSARHDDGFYGAIWRSVRETGHWHGEVWSRRRDGGVVPELLTVSAVPGPDGSIKGYIGLFSDISQLKRSEERLTHLAHHDTLTGLPNRLLFNARLEQAIERANRLGGSLAVIFIDLDRFKLVNDRLGHQSGDELLKQVAVRLTDPLRAQDTVARISGDEFVVLLDEIHEVSDLVAVVDRLMRTLDGPIAVAGERLQVAASMGACVYPRDGEDAETLLRHADAAMYRAKEEGRNTYRFYAPEMTRMALENAAIDNALKGAIDGGELHLVYQSQLDLGTGTLVGLETLLRWHHEGLGDVAPARLIEVAERNGMIGAIGGWVMRAACLQARAWLDAGLDFGRIAVNVSGQQLRAGGLDRQVETILAETGCPPSRLELEITEGYVMRRPEQAVEQLRRIRRLGVSLAIDDFGTGSSSLRHLKALPIDKLKIERSFVRDIRTDPNDKAIVASIIALGHALGKIVVAEGVETPAQAAFLWARGCDQVQGFLYGRPEPAERLVERLGQAELDDG